MSSNASFIKSPSAAYRGVRGYVHSTDLYQEVLAGAEEAGLAVSGPLTFRLRRRITNVPRYHFSASTPVSLDAAALCSFVAAGTTWFVSVVETDVPVTARRPYDESSARERCVIEGRSARLTAATDLRPIEALTALAVHLHGVVLQPPDGLRWMLGQLSLDRPLREDDATTLQVSLDQVVGGKMTRSSLTGVDGLFGTVLFISG
jgi:hypothetical protein